MSGVPLKLATSPLDINVPKIWSQFKFQSLLSVFVAHQIQMLCNKLGSQVPGESLSQIPPLPFIGGRCGGQTHLSYGGNFDNEGSWDPIWPVTAFAKRIYF